MFTVGEPAPPEYLIDRVEEVDELVSLLSNPRIVYNVAVLGYRRIGKTSILNKVERRLASQNIIVVRFDVKKNIGAPETFFKRLNVEIFNAYISHISKGKKFKTLAGRFGSQVVQTITGVLSKKRLKGVSIETSVSADGTIAITPKIEFADGREPPDYQKVMETIFSTAKVFAEESNTRFVIMLDEFQDIIKLRRYSGLRNIIDQFRSVMQERGTKVSYLICGSHVHTLKEFLYRGDSSVFMHFKEYSVHELKYENALKLFESYALARGIKERRGEKEIRALAEEAYKIVGGHPFYLMSLAEAWDEKRKEKIEETFERELRSPIGSLRLYEEYVLSEDLGEAQGGPALRTILQFLASSRRNNASTVPLSGTEIANLLNRPFQQIESYLTELTKFDVITKNEKDKKYAIRDKVLEQYLRMETEELDKKIVLPGYSDK